MNHIRLTTCIIALIITHSTTYSQTATTTEISLNECRELALKNSSTLQALREQSSAQEFNLKAIKSDFLPSLTAAASASYMVGSPEGENIPSNSLRDYSYIASLTLRQNIWEGGTTTHSARAAKLELEVSKLNTLRTEQQIIYSAEVNYWSYTAAILQQKAMEDYLATINNLLESIKIRYNEGYTSRQDLLMIETRLQDALLQLSTAQQYRKTSLINLNTTLGNIEEINYIPSDSLTLPRTPFQTHSYDYALTHRYDLLSFEKNIEVQNENIDIARSLYNPQIWLSIEGYYGTPTPNFPTSHNALYSLAKINFSAPIFEFGKRRKSVNAAKSTAKSAKNLTEELRNTIAGEVKTATTNLTEEYHKTTLAHQSLAIAHENLELSTYSYTEGKLPILDVLSAQLSWIGAYTAYINSLHSYALAVSAYHLAVGEF